MDKLRALQTFAAIVDHGSLTAAAHALGGSLPATVRTLAALEASLGVRLLNRTTRRLSLTDDGRLYLERVRRVLAELDDAERALASHEQAEPSGALTLTAPVLYGQLHVAPAVTRFLQRHPKLHVKLLLLDRVVDLVEEGIDAAVRIARLADSTLVAQRVAQVRRVVVASPALLRRVGTPAHPRELARLPCVRFTATEGAAWCFREQGRRFTVPVRGPLDVNLSAPALEACAAGLGFGQFLSYQVEPDVRARRLRIVLAAYELDPVDVNLVVPSARGLPWRTRVLLDFMKQALGQPARA